MSVLVFSVGDKSCDVYRFNLNDAEYGRGQLLLGHVSMLLDLQLSRDQKFIATCDRDEKIRITQYPKCHQIQSFCLGHREFVTTCAFVDIQRLVSGSGDGTIACLEYLTGRLLFSQKVHQNDVESDRKKADDFLVGVCQVFALDERRVLVTLLNRSHVLLYSVKDSEFKLLQRLDVKHKVVHAAQQGSRVWLIVRQQCLQCVHLQTDLIHLVQTPLTQVAVREASLQQHLQQLDTKTFYEQMYKCAHDNVEKYYENKRKRQQLQSGKITSSMGDEQQSK